MIFFTKIFGWFMTGGWKWILILSVLSTLAWAGWQLYTDYRDTKNALIEQTEQRVAFEAANSANLETLRTMRLFSEELDRRNSELNINLEKARERSIRLERLLSEHDLEFLARSKPGLIEKRINDATNNVFRDIECDTGGMCD